MRGGFWTTKFNRATRRAGDRFRLTGSEEAWREFARLRRTARRVRLPQPFAKALTVKERWPTRSYTFPVAVTHYEVPR
jgi:hypothetical protein